MKRDIKVDLFEKVKEFRNTVIENTPSKEVMTYEVRMMNFKIKPVVGEVFDIDFENEEFIEALWRLGKLDEFFQSEIQNLNKSERPIFFQIVNNMKSIFQNRLNRIHATVFDIESQPNRELEVEIIKDNNWKVN